MNIHPVFILLGFTLTFRRLGLFDAERLAIRVIAHVLPALLTPQADDSSPNT